MSAEVLILGATGVVGGRVAAEVVRALGAERVAIAGRHPGRLESVRRSLDLDTKRAVLIGDVGAQTEIEAATRVVMSCAGPGYAVEVAAAEAAIRAGAHFVSTNDDASATKQVMELADSALSAGTVLVGGCAFAPGITGALAAFGAEQLDQVEDVSISLASSAQDASGPASTLHLADMFASPATELDDATLQEVEDRKAVPVYFPEPVGWVETFPVAHPEVETFPLAHPDVTSVRCRFGLTEKVVMDIVRASAAAGLLHPSLRGAWTAATSPLRPFVASLPPRGAAWSAARVDVRGTKGGRRRSLSFGVADKLVNLAAAAAAQAVVALLSYEGDPGFAGPERLIEPRRLLGELTRRGLRFARLEPASY